ncbi:hypothetical protein M406DRAFT_355763 [Cryphonectria parasitica EP155]|uniref:C6 transcription factor n=1 Tax=Cryphonectria parasitica (strain ATCC 38755 / EP155) TaxID=660469 RepID=A0A9P4Y725_CRYP1|nr:uncharacterized protein M406DRAFT_355763 [Cryphonectria parasitica EP155]KAF3767923.1 hypothetical protein M406DRAFT_355763 [Cryphonectria parasitica EP155]
MNHYPQGDTLDEIQELLSVAEQHHTMSLQYLQDAIPEAARYDCILASAALMMLYGSASHCVRIRLFEMHKVQQSDTPMPSQFVPAHSQWISLIRAVHLAYIGIVADRAKNPTGAADDGQGLGNQSPHVVGPEAVIGAVSPPEDGPTHDTRQLFLPIVAATSGSAMEKLRAKACRLMETAGGNPGLQACWEALVVLETTVARTFAHHDTLSINTKAEAEDSLLPDTIPLWMRAYIARVTSNSGCSSSPLRRTINAFLNRVPASYVQLVQEMLNLIPLEGDRWDENQEKLQRQTLGFVNPDNYVASRLAVEILAHWLVLVLLLDGVWWIGETGSWELGRVVAFVRGSGWLEETVDQESEDAWWPRSMYEIRIHLRRLGI